MVAVLVMITKRIQNGSNNLHFMTHLVSIITILLCLQCNVSPKASVFPKEYG